MGRIFRGILGEWDKAGTEAPGQEKFCRRREKSGKTGKIRRNLGEKNERVFFARKDGKSEKTRFLRGGKAEIVQNFWGC